MKILNSISLGYAAIMIMIGVMLIVGKSMYDQSDRSEYVLYGVVILHGLLQFIYSKGLRSKMSLPTYVDLQTLDNELGFSEDYNVEVVANSEFVLICASAASFVELAMSWIFLRRLFRFEFGEVANAFDLAQLLLMVFGGLFSGIVLYHNLRTWKLKWIVPSKDF